jgi:hypothetical protein
MTTHSPVALRELSADQLYVLRRTVMDHEALKVGSYDHMQSTVRACPEAFLAPSVIVCEGASEIGLLRGLDLYRVDDAKPSIAALGVALADGHGDTTFRRANALAALRYRVLILRDDDKDPDAVEAETFAATGGTVLAWRNRRALEEELFASLSDRAVGALIEAAVENVGEERVDMTIRSASGDTMGLAHARAGVTAVVRDVLGKAATSNAKTRKPGWFKSVTAMETVGRAIVGPDLATSDGEFRAIIERLFAWVADAGR